MDNQQRKNSLSKETSPYLLQHVHNPVNWHPWGKEALARAKQLDKPILLSIGYSACHWCHVMAHESFEDQDTAAIMNEHFINIKVDREERPDLDKIYQTAQNLLTQRTGGWPLTMFLTPDDHIPFFGGTYFPPTSRYGLPGFKDLLLRVAEFYKQERDAIRRQNQSVQQALQQMTITPAPDDGLQLTPEPLHLAISQLESSFEPEYGGFGSAPKFPHPTNIARLLRYYAGGYSGINPETVLHMAEYTLNRMALGGVYDQIGGGFCRYSVDERWDIPHFEKMLYDNGPLLTLYAQTWQITGNPLYKAIAQETADWVIRDMQSPEGAYYSTLDADSEGHEGKFYVWDKEELRKILNKNEYAVAEKYFGLGRPPNFEGRWHLNVAERIDPQDKTAVTLLRQAKHKLLEVRNKRVWPGRDEKILTSWNGLMIQGMATAAISFDDAGYFNSAARALEFIRTTLWKNNRLLATCKDGKAHLNAYLDDYVFLIEGILTLLQYRWNTDWLHFAVVLAGTVLEIFEDKDKGGFYFTSHDHEQLIQRTKPYVDEATPSGNGSAAQVFLQLGHLLGDDRYLEAAERTLKSAWHSIERYPAAHNSLLNALEDTLRPPRQIILRGNDAELRQWWQVCRQHMDILGRVYPISTEATHLPGLLRERKSMGGSVAYICAGHQCQAPVTRLDLIPENLNNSKF